MKTSLYLIRHAEVEESYHRVFGGRLDIGLSGQGELQATRLAEWLSRVRFDATYASPLKRVQQTFAPAVNVGLPTPVLLPDLREVDFGDWTGLGWDEVNEQFGVSAYDWLRVLERGGFPNGECGVQLRLRIEECLQQILRERAGCTVAVFAHGGVIRMLMTLLLDLPLNAMERFDVDYAGVTWLEVGGIKAGRARTEIRLMNYTPWRDG